MVRVFLMILFAFSVTGCASIFTGQYDPVTFSSEPQGATVVINGVAYGKTPTTFNMKRGFGVQTAQLSLDGYQPRTVMVTNTFNLVTLLDILFWPSFIVDAATGSMMSYSPI